MIRSFLLLLSLTVIGSGAAATEVCTIVMETKRREAVYWQGSCAARYTPASTFKIPLAVMGFDSGFLKSSDEPALQRGATATESERLQDVSVSPEQWIRLSAVWYSRQVAEALGLGKLRAYAQAFHYGNADFSDMQDVAARPAWLSSSLRISPLEQTQFLSRMAEGDLPVSPLAIKQARALLESHSVHNWTISGKTGSTRFEHMASHEPTPNSLGWYVGWAESNGRTLAFASLLEASSESGAAGVRARRHLLLTWPDILQRLGY